MYKTECVRQEGPWRTVDELELAILNWVHWWNHRRLHGEIGMIPPAEAEDIYDRHNRPIRDGRFPTSRVPRLSRPVHGLDPTGFVQTVLTASP